MKLDRFNLLKKKFEENAFEHNFFTLDRILYWFSFLGNIFSIIFSYFFIKTVTDTIPKFFSGQNVVFAVFIIVFMTGYEFLKRFTFEQAVVYYFKLKKFTTSFVFGLLFALVLVAGSFYLSLNGSHRLIDKTEQVNTTTDNTIQVKVDSLSELYNGRIQSYQKLISDINDNAVNGRLRSKDKADIKNYESMIAQLSQELEAKIASVESKLQSKVDKKLESTKSNTIALVILTLFMEIIILLGVGFNGYYTISTYSDMKLLLNTPKYKTLQLNLALLNLFYQKGNKKEGDQVLATSKLKSLVANQKIDARGKDVEEFITLCTELNIITVGNNKRKYYVCSYEKAKELLTETV